MIEIKVKIKETKFGAGVLVSSNSNGATEFEAMIADVVKSSIEMATSVLKSVSDEDEKKEAPEPKKEPRVQDEWVDEVLKELEAAEVKEG